MSMPMKCTSRLPCPILMSEQALPSWNSVRTDVYRSRPLPQVWRRAFNETGALAPLLYLLSPPTYACFDGDYDSGMDSLAGCSTRSSGIRRVPSLLSSSASGAAGVRDENSVLTRISTGERPVRAAGTAARAQAIRMLQVLITGSAAAAPAVRPQVRQWQFPCANVFFRRLRMRCAGVPPTGARPYGGILEDLEWSGL